MCSRANRTEKNSLLIWNRQPSEPLKNIELLKKVYVNPDTGTIEWHNGADFAPEFLCEAGQEVKKSA